MTGPAANANNRIWLIGYLAFFVALSFAKAAAILLEPRFWAEEGAFYFANFRTLDAWGALLFVTSGNYQLLTNALVYLATQVPLAHAPAVTTYGAYLVEALVVVLIYAVVAGYGINRLVGLLLVAAWTLMPASYETWASATNVQWICSASMLFIMVLPNESIERNFTKTLVWTAVCGLTGVTSCMLAPGYLARAYFDRSKHFAVLGGLLALCAVLQVAVLMRYGVQAERTFTLDLRIMTLPTLLQTIFVPLLGVEWVDELSKPLRDGARAAAVVTYVAGVFLMLVAVAAALQAQRMAIVLIVAGLWVLVSVLNTFGALGDPIALVSSRGSPRYFLFGAMCFCLLLAFGTASRRWPGSIAATALLIVIAGVSAAQIGSNWTAFHTKGPSWKKELAKCGSAPCEVAIWPNGWNVKLQSAR